jgi:hypothetical protein
MVDREQTFGAHVDSQFQCHSTMLDACETTTPPVGGTPSIALKTSCVRQAGGFHAGLINSEDTDLWLRLGTTPTFVRIAEPPVFAQRQHSASTTADLTRSYRGALFLVQREQAGVYPGGDAAKERRRRIIAATARNTSLRCLLGGDTREAVDLYVATVMWNLTLGHLRYVAAFPGLALLSGLRSLCTRSPSRLCADVSGIDGSA